LTADKAAWTNDSQCKPCNRATIGVRDQPPAWWRNCSAWRRRLGPQAEPAQRALCMSPLTKAEIGERTARPGWNCCDHL